jgi:hypothetical protein
MVRYRSRTSLRKWDTAAIVSGVALSAAAAAMWAVSSQQFSSGDSALAKYETAQSTSLAQQARGDAEGAWQAGATWQNRALWSGIPGITLLTAGVATLLGWPSLTEPGLNGE